ncbi:MAG: hypothetical protein KDA62_22405 [Planctomycetales bacterium]|nr:hypothetical protein [Planctomycetales bacterium]
MTALEIGDRVTLKGHWEFPDGTIGTIAHPPDFVIGVCGAGEWQGHRRIHSCRKGMMTSYYVVFDTPADDGSGHGPYLGGEIDESSIHRM